MRVKVAELWFDGVPHAISPMLTEDAPTAEIAKARLRGRVATMFTDREAEALSFVIFALDPEED